MTSPAESSVRPAAPAPGRNPWPWGIVAAFGVFIAGTLGLIVLALFNNQDLVTADYYEQELRYQQTLDSRARAAALGAEAGVSFDPDTRRLSLILPPRHTQDRPAGAIQLYRPASAREDRQLPLDPDEAGRQELDVSELAPGPWRVRVEWWYDGQPFTLEHRLVIPPQKP